jgi:hypothetical protein
MIVSDTDEGSRMGSGTHRRLTNDRRGRQMTLNSSSISQHPSSTLQDDATYAKFLRDFTHFPSDYYHVRLLIINSHVYSSPLTYYSLPIAAQMTLNSVTGEFFSTRCQEFHKAQS